MSNKSTIRVGVIGAGANTKQRHIPALKGIDGVELVRVCNRSIESSRSAAEEFGITSFSDNWRDITDADDIDAVVIGTWPYLHCPVTLASLEGNKHVLCEARMAMDSREAHKMLDAAKRNPALVAMVVPSPFSLGVDATVQRLISQEYFGRLISIEVRGLAQSFPDPGAPLHWREDRALSGNNVLTLGIWYEALLRWIGEAKSVIAMGQTVIRSRKDLADGVDRGISVPDHVDVVAETHRGAQLHMQLSSVAHHPGGPEVWLHGTDGVLRFADGNLTGMQKGDPELEPIAVPPDESGEWRVEEEFIGAIRGEEPVRLTTFDDGVRYMEFTDAVCESMSNGRAVALPYGRQHR